MSDPQQQSIALIAQAESILNRTLAYHAAIAVHEIKDRPNLDVEELRLVVAPLRPEAPGTCHVVCTIASLAMPDPLVREVVVQPDKAVARPSSQSQFDKTGAQTWTPGNRLLREVSEAAHELVAVCGTAFVNG